MKTCYLICRDYAIAEDLTSEVYLIVWQKAAHWDCTRGSAIAWVCAIARNRSIDWLRKQSIIYLEQIEEAQSIPDNSPLVEVVLAQSSEIRAALAALDTLPSRQRTIIHSAFFEGHNHREIAELKKLPLGTVKSWIRRGLAEMRRHIEEIQTQSAD